MVPAKTPPALVKRIAGEIQKAMKDPGLVQRLEQQALVPVADTPEQFAASLKEEQQNWGSFIKAHNIQPE
jgi:tripartite-type tricarboxylate transporter receptor subunit TctC